MKPSTLLPLSLGLVILFACRTSAPTSAPAGDVVAWAKGTGHRIVAGEGVPSRALIYNDTGEVKAMGTCVPGAVSMLPAPGGDTRLFMLRSGFLTVSPLPPDHASPTPVAWSSGSPVPTLTSLLAARASGASVELLVLGHAGDAAGASDDYYLLQVSASNTIVAIASAAGLPELADRDAFYSAFPVTRCREAGRSCILFGTFQEKSFIDLEPTPDAPPRPLRELAGEVLDVAWYPGQGDSLIVLARCDPAEVAAAEAAPG